MLHLSSERLAELADGEPTVAEAEHLAACAICATERSAHQRLLSMALDERDRTAPRLTEWSTLAAKLREQGIISDDYTAPVTGETKVIPLVQPRPHRRAWLVGLRVAAGLVFAAGFGALGRMSAGANPAPSGSEMTALATRIFRGPAEQVLPHGFGDQSSPRSRRLSGTTIAPSRSSPRTTPRSSRRTRVTSSVHASPHSTRWPRRRVRLSPSPQPILC
jgi:hypothetical protein